jgi:histidine triad (HIT) family protein
MDCIFCRIVDGEILSDTVYSDDRVIAFRDINPMAPVHVQVIPREHIARLSDVPEDGASLLGHMVSVANGIARAEGVADTGYRVVINCGEQGGQLVPHLHLHLLGGRQLSGQLG